MGSYGKFGMNISSLTIVDDQIELSISNIVYGFRDVFFSKKKDYGDSGACNVNVNCPEGVGWENPINASLMYLLNNNTRVCTGTMLNNVNNDGTPYFLSADFRRAQYIHMSCIRISNHVYENHLDL